MPRYTRWLLGALLALGLVPLTQAAADNAPPLCTGNTVTGTVTAVEAATGQVTLDTGGGELCSVYIHGDADHPIVRLLGRYFDDTNLADLQDALETTDVWVVCANGACTLAEAGAPGAVHGRVIDVAENADGTATLTVELDGQAEAVHWLVDDADLIDAYQRALADLRVQWDLRAGADGPEVLDAETKIAELHQDGLGFGVIVKLYAVAEASQAKCEQTQAVTNGEPCGVTVDELVAEFRSGTGLGQIFQKYGKPGMVGVGHVRQALRNATATPENGGADDNEAGDGDDDAERTPAPDATHPGCGHGQSSAHNPHCATSTPAAGDQGNANNGDHGNNGNNGNNGNHGNNGNNGNGHGKP